jgi:prepilin-type processing-associated H-X9-DG protein
LLLPFMEQQALFTQFDVFNNQSIWPAGSFSTAEWKTPARLRAMAARPQVMVCPSSTFGAVSEEFKPPSYDPAPATGSYAFSAGHRGINGGVTYSPTDACMVKHYNSGLHLYMTAYEVQQVEDGTSATFSVGEVVEADGAPNSAAWQPYKSSNVWTYTRRYLDCFRTTSVALNTPPWAETLNVNGDVVNGGFASEHPTGGNFVFADGHVDFISDSIAFAAYQEFSTIAGAPDVSDATMAGFCKQLKDRSRP